MMATLMNRREAVLHMQEKIEALLEEKFAGVPNQRNKHAELEYEVNKLQDYALVNGLLYLEVKTELARLRQLIYKLEWMEMSSPV